MDQTATLARDFERESYRIDQLIWDAMALRAGESALFCGVSNSVDWIKRAVEIGADVSVISNDPSGVSELRGVPITVLRGSTSMLHAHDASFDVTIAFHYLHEIDPFFHATVVSELARVGKRCVIVEPAPPSDPLGLRIAALYSRAKRELGQFENYHHIDYWRKLLAIVKADVSYQTFAFTRSPPREVMRGSVALIIDTMAAEDTPAPYLAELRALAKRPDAQLLPQSRYVIVGTLRGALVNANAGTDYRDGLPEEVRPDLTAPTLSPPVIEKAAVPPAAASSANTPRVYSRPDTEPEFPAVGPPLAPATAPQPSASQVARNAFGLPAREESPRRAPTAPSVKGDDAAPVIPDEPADAAAEFGWEWETPRGS